MDSPFNMSFDEILAQANANMAADRGEAPAPTPAQETPAQETPVQETPAQETANQSTANATEGKSFLEMVEDAQKDKNAGKTEQPQPAGGAQTQTAETAQSQTDEFGGMNFDDLLKQADAGTPTTTETPAAETPVATKQGTVTTEMSFDSLMEQALNEGQAAASPSKTEPAVSSASTEKEPFTQSNGGGQTFDDLLKEAEMLAETPKAEEPKAEEPKAEEPKAEEPKAEEPKAEEPKAEEPKAEEPKAEELKGKKSGSRKKKKEEEEPKEPLPDNTAEYEVDLTGDGESGNEQKEEPAVEEVHETVSKDVSGAGSDLALDKLFTEDEIKDLRTMIRSFVRREIKKAMVGAFTDLLSEFKDERV